MQPPAGTSETHPEEPLLLQLLKQYERGHRGMGSSDLARSKSNSSSLNSLNNLAQTAGGQQTQQADQALRVDAKQQQRKVVLSDEVESPKRENLANIDLLPTTKSEPSSPTLDGKSNKPFGSVQPPKSPSPIVDTAAHIERQEMKLFEDLGVEKTGTVDDEDEISIAAVKTEEKREEEEEQAFSPILKNLSLFEKKKGALPPINAKLEPIRPPLPAISSSALPPAVTDQPPPPPPSNKPVNSLQVQPPLFSMPSNSNSAETAASFLESVSPPPQWKRSFVDDDDEADTFDHQLQTTDCSLSAEDLRLDDFDYEEQAEILN